MNNSALQKNKRVEVLIRPHVTEKAWQKSELKKGAAYVFLVSDSATKPLIVDAIQALYKVRPIRVNITRLPSKKIKVRGRDGIRKGKKKATVYLNPGEKIEIV